jgi:hypothetical protein
LRLPFYLRGRKPLLLHSTIREDNSLLSVDATNLATQSQMMSTYNKEPYTFSALASLSEGSGRMQFRRMNYRTDAHEVSLAFLFDADFARISEVRGERRENGTGGD